MIWTLTSSFSDKLTADGIEILLNDEPMFIGMTFNTSESGSTLKLVSNDFYLLSAGGGFDPRTGSPQLTATISEDQKIATFNGGGWGDPLPDMIPYTLGDPLPDTGGGGDSDSINSVNDVYKLTLEDAKEVLRRDFKVPNGAGEFKDYSQFLLNMLYLPFNIDDRLGLQTTVKLKDLDTGISGYYVESDLLRFNLGEITITGENGSSLDFANTVTVLHLPYFKSFNIDIEYVMNETLSIEYIFNVYNNQLTVNVSSTKIDGVILSDNVSLDTRIPFTIDYIETPTWSKDLSMSVDNGIKTAFIEVLRNDAVLENSMFNISVADEDYLNSFTGYVEVDNIDFKGGVTSYEHQLINDVLKQGVIINV